MNKGKIFLKGLALTFPLWLILLVYVYTDPFKVLYSYHFENYYDWQHWELNREVASVSNLRERLDKNDVPDAYIFGNSRSLVFRCDTWESYLNDQTKPFHFDAASETLFGFYKKVKYLDGKNIRIRDALLVSDVSLFSKTENDHDVIHIKHPDISGESRFAFQANFIKGYFTNFFFLKQIDFLLFGKTRKYMSDIFAIEPGYVRVSPYENDYFYHKSDSMLAKDSVGYYVYKKDVFFDRSSAQVASDAVIKEKQIAMLEEIKKIFDKDSTRFKIVISPLYDQKKINRADIKALENIFGPHVIYDYSGKNEITENRSNYYEISHYKPYIAEKIMSDIYAK